MLRCLIKLKKDVVDYHLKFELSICFLFSILLWVDRRRITKRAHIFNM